MLAAAPQPEQVESEPVAYYSAHYKTPTGTKEFHGFAENPLPAGTKLYTTPQPDRTAELEAALKVARDALIDCEGALDECRGYPITYDTVIETIAKINEVLK